MITGKVSLDLSDLERRLSQDNHEKAMRQMLEAQALPDMNNYVPLRDNPLRESGHVEDFETVAWDTPYAAAQYKGIIHGGVVMNYTTPGTGPYWDLVAKGNHMEDWLNAYLKGAGYH